MKNDFESIKAEAEKLYKTIGEVYCPYFKEKVVFNSQGLDHLTFKRLDKRRLGQDQYERFKLLHLAPEIIRNSHTLQGYKEMKRFERIRKNNRTENILMSITHYEFIAIVKRNRVRIIVKQVGNGPRVFLSIIPHWKMNKNRDRVFFNGESEE
jgi:hypothetical protein